MRIPTMLLIVAAALAGCTDPTSTDPAPTDPAPTDLDPQDSDSDTGPDTKPEPGDGNGTAPAGPVQQLRVSWQVGTIDVGSAPEHFVACEAGPLDGVTHATFQADEATAGLPFTATLAVDAGADAMNSWTLLFFSADCQDHDSFSAEGAADIEGTVPRGKPFVLAFATGGVGLEVTYTAG